VNSARWRSSQSQVGLPVCLEEADEPESLLSLPALDTLNLPSHRINRPMFSAGGPFLARIAVAVIARPSQLVMCPGLKSSRLRGAN
jgi:hypothetical protein